MSNKNYNESYCDKSLNLCQTFHRKTYFSAIFSYKITEKSNKTKNGITPDREEFKKDFNYLEVGNFGEKI